MINEERLAKYYSAIAEKLDEMIPCEWNKVVLYGEENGDVSSASFYFFTNDAKVHHSGDIPEEYNISRELFKDSLRELLEINKDLWIQFKESDEPTWCLLTFELNSDSKFRVTYGYEKNNEIGRLEREIRWAYDQLGIVPEDEYEKELLEEYLEEKGAQSNQNKFYPVTMEEINDLEKTLKIEIPKELKDFWLQFGYGFIAGTEGNINRMLDTESIRDFRLREGDFEFYPDIEIYDEYEDGRLIFFEGSESALISIGVTEQNMNLIFYYDVKIADSLEEFLKKMQEDDNYYLEMLE